MYPHKEIKIRITSLEHCKQVLDYLKSQGRGVCTAELTGNLSKVKYVYTSDKSYTTWGSDCLDDDEYFINKPFQEVTFEHRPIEYFFKPIYRYSLKIEGDELFINGFKVKQEDLNNLLASVNG